MKKFLGSLIISGGLLIGYLALGNTIYPSSLVAETIKVECNLNDSTEHFIHSTIENSYFNHIPNSHKIYDKYTMIVYYYNCGYGNSFTVTPYYNSNGKLCKYNPDTDELIEVGTENKTQTINNLNETDKDKKIQELEDKINRLNKVIFGQ